MSRPNSRRSIHLTRAAARRFGLLLAGLILAGAAAGCSAAPAKGPDAAQMLQSQVLAVTEAAAANDPAGTLALLDDLAEKLNGAAMDGDITFQRHQSIMAAIDALRTELTAHLPSAPMTATVAAEPSPAAPPADQVSDQTDAVEPEVMAPVPFIVWAARAAPPPVRATSAAHAPVVQPPAAPVAPAPSPTPTRSSHGNAYGKGNGKG